MSDYGLKMYSLLELAVKHHIILQTLKVWIRKYYEGKLFVTKGFNRRGFPLKSTITDNGKKDINKDREELLREINTLRIENAMLKKVNALIVKEYEERVQCSMSCR